MTTTEATQQKLLAYLRRIHAERAALQRRVRDLEVEAEIARQMERTAPPIPG